VEKGKNKATIANVKWEEKQERLYKMLKMRFS